jgi:Exopolysaccharide biosynthesis protein YbjH
MNTRKKIFLVYLMLLGTGYPDRLWAQVNVSGKAGLLYIPSAVVPEDGLVTAGYVYNPMNYAIKFNRTNSESIFFVNVVVLPRLEVNVNLLRPNGSIPFKAGGIGDRQLDVKYAVLTERKKRPSVAVILSAPFGVDNSLLTHAVVATKHMTVTKRIEAGLTLGMGSPYSIGRRTNANDILSDFKLRDKRERPYHYLTGPFGGVNLSLDKKAGLLVEWDSQHLNVGAYATLFRHWTVQAGLLNGDQVMLGTSYALQLLRLPKRFVASHETGIR